MPAPSRGLNISLWVVQALLSLGFLISGSMSLGGHHMKTEDFDLIGWGQWFRYVTGAIETLSAVLIVLPKFTRLAAALIICVMIGATIANLTALHMKDIYTPPFLMLLAAFVLWGRRPQKS